MSSAAEARYAGRFPDFRAEELAAYRFYVFRPDRLKLFDEHELGELAQSIREHGVLQPVLVSQQPDGSFQLITGERRWRAVQLAGLPTVPAEPLGRTPPLRMRVWPSPSPPSGRGWRANELRGSALLVISCCYWIRVTVKVPV